MAEQLSVYKTDSAPWVRQDFVNFSTIIRKINLSLFLQVVIDSLVSSIRRRKNHNWRKISYLQDYVRSSWKGRTLTQSQCADASKWRELVRPTLSRVTVTVRHGVYVRVCARARFQQFSRHSTTLQPTVSHSIRPLAKRIVMKIKGHAPFHARNKLKPLFRIKYTIMSGSSFQHRVQYIILLSDNCDSLQRHLSGRTLFITNRLQQNLLGFYDQCQNTFWIFDGLPRHFA
jgi:hypothetical protein